MSRIRDFSKPSTEQRTKIVGAVEIGEGGEPQRLDSKTKQEPQPAEIRVHEESITEADQIRAKKPEPGEPEIRFRHSEGAKAFDKVKRLEDE